jgi:VanZ family protein
VKKVAFAVMSNGRLRWFRLCGVVAVAALIFASVLLPPAWEQLRSGHWALEHFFAYFIATSIVCLGWRRPFVVAGGLAAIAAPLLEGLQSLEPTHSANFLSVISGASGAFAAALVASVAGPVARRTLNRDD